MDQELLINLLLAVLQVVVLVVGGFLVNYLKTKIGVENYNKYYSIVEKVITSVEQTLGPGRGQDKKDEAIQIIKKALGNKLTEEQINMFIEAAVFQMNTVLKNNKQA